MDSSPSTTGTSGTGLAAASAASDHRDTRTAATEVAAAAHDALDGGCDLALLFVSFHHASAIAEAATIVRQTLDPEVLLGTTTSAVFGGDGSLELEQRPGISLLGARLPGTRLHPVVSTPMDPIRISEPQTIPERIGLEPDHSLTLLLAEPFTTPLRRLLPAIGRAGGPDRVLPVAGGVASGGNRPGINRLVLNDETLDAGAVGVTLSGPVGADVILSQGCRPVGEPMVVTSARDHLLLGLAGRPALDVLEELVQSADERDRASFAQGLLLGTAIDEGKSYLGRGDFVIRSVLGLDRRLRSIVTGEPLRLGRTVQFHVMDPETAEEDLHLLLDRQQLRPPAIGGLLFQCTGRNASLFGRENHDLIIARRRLGDAAVAGCVSAGEIGPAGEEVVLHGQTTCLVVLRERDD